MDYLQNLDLETVDFKPSECLCASLFLLYFKFSCSVNYASLPECTKKF